MSIVPVLTKGDLLMEESGAAPVTAGDVQVWVNTASKVYHCPGSRYYENTRRGRLMAESAAVRSGARPSGGRRCG